MSFYRKKLLLAASSLALLTSQSASGQTDAVAAIASDAAPEQVLITGSLLGAGTGFAAPTPVTEVGQVQIEQRAAGSVFEIIRDIPSFRGTTGPSANSTGAQNASKANLDLRGLGSVRTLVLINGRRHVPDGNTGVFDTNLIPTSLIERVDILHHLFSGSD